MENKKVVPTWLNVLSLVLALGGLALTIYSMLSVEANDATGIKMEYLAIHVLMIFPLLASLLYCLSGYKKSSAIYFNAVTYLYAIVMAVTAVLVREGPAFLPAFAVLAFGILCVLAFGKDLGKKKSFILAGTNAALALIRVIVYAIGTGHILGGMVVNFLVAIVLCNMIYAKYADKAARGAE